MIYIFAVLIIVIAVLNVASKSEGWTSSSSHTHADDLARMSDPYQTPGVDLVVDEYHHGIDRGMGYVNSHQWD
ncbi:MAG: hypothetical protein P0Y55_14140 [Candidatus Cohnella colombiensis]|uniref:Uncharacterized protein n=1 Tax=Candidatus Cohnella colombiensis TaxID=3121368 RepID=A0AA95J9W1_9BACL|nr:MAG: hypothetical protein P0Y55_14140 [Cohnella sp.]